MYLAINLTRFWNNNNNKKNYYILFSFWKSQMIWSSILILTNYENTDIINMVSELSTYQL